MLVYVCAWAYLRTSTQCCRDSEISCSNCPLRTYVSVHMYWIIRISVRPTSVLIPLCDPSGDTRQPAHMHGLVLTPWCLFSPSQTLTHVQPALLSLLDTRTTAVVVWFCGADQWATQHRQAAWLLFASLPHVCVVHVWHGAVTIATLVVPCQG